MELRVLEFNIESNEVVKESGSIVNLDNCTNVHDALVAYAEYLATNSPEVAVIKPLLVFDNTGEIKTFELWNIDEFGIPCVTIEDLGLNIKPLCKEDIVMNIDEVVNGLETDIKEAVNRIVNKEDGNLNRVEKNFKAFIARGGDACEWIQSRLRLAGGICRDKVNNNYTTLNNRINDKIAKLLAVGNDSKKNILKRIGGFVLVTFLQVLKALMGVVKFAADVVISIAKYVGCTVIDITNGIGTVAMDIVNAFKTDLINIYKKPVMA